MPQSFASLHCHLVFSTKHRETLISAELQPRLYAYIGGIVKNQSSRLIAAGGMPDHIHLLVSLPRTMSIADMVRVIKSNSSGWIHEEFPALRAVASVKLRTFILGLALAGRSAPNSVAA